MNLYDYIIDNYDRKFIDKGYTLTVICNKDFKIRSSKDILILIIDFLIENSFEYKAINRKRVVEVNIYENEDNVIIEYYDELKGKSNDCFNLLINDGKQHVDTMFSIITFLIDKVLNGTFEIEEECLMKKISITLPLH